jgi:hypothetical protein
VTDQSTPLDEIYAGRVAFAESYASWYRHKKRSRQLIAIVLRMLATVLVVAGGLCPIAAQAGVPGLEKWGYVLIGLAGGIFLFDKSLGYSAAWLRYMMAASRIEAEIEGFKLRWIALTGRPENSGKRHQQALALAESFTKAVSGIVLDETRTWQRDFIATTPRAGGGMTHH